MLNGTLGRWAKEAKLAIESKTNPKSFVFLQYVASKTRHKENISNLTKQDRSLTETDKEKASVLNNFFCSVFTEESAQHVNKSPGPDGLHPRMLKELSHELSHPWLYYLTKV